MTPQRGAAILVGALALTTFYVSANGEADKPPPAPEIITEIIYKDRIVEKRVEVPVEVVRQKQLPQACVTMVDAVSDIEDLNVTANVQTGRLLAVLDGSVRDINGQDYTALNNAVSEVRDIRNKSGNARIDIQRAIDSFTTAREKCRQEIAK